MNISEMAESVASKDQLAAFVHALANDLHSHPEEWENATLETYLEALGVWLEVKGEGPAQTPRWKDIAHMLIAAKVYE